MPSLAFSSAHSYILVYTTHSGWDGLMRMDRAVLGSVQCGAVRCGAVRCGAVRCKWGLDTRGMGGMKGWSVGSKLDTVGSWGYILNCSQSTGAAWSQAFAAALGSSQRSATISSHRHRRPVATEWHTATRRHMRPLHVRVLWNGGRDGG